MHVARITLHRTTWWALNYAVAILKPLSFVQANEFSMAEPIVNESTVDFVGSPNR